ncbi:MAG: acyltransferase [Opitutaceae bacterium]|nr:acyltransferase [Opitutaceae bacterium]
MPEQRPILTNESADAPEASGRVFGLDVYRSAAILFVTFSHGLLAHNLRLTTNAVAPGFKAVDPLILLTEHWGALGVELFFVLSGFLIGKIVIELKEAWSLQQVGHFLVRRWFRTLPLFWTMVLVNWAYETHINGRSLTVASVVGHAAFLQNFWRPRFEFMPESWSLAVEEWFYLVLPLLLFAAARFFRSAPQRRFLYVTGAIYVASLGLRFISALDPNAEWVMVQRCSTLLRFDSLMTGVLAAWFCLRYPSYWKRLAAPAAIVGLPLAYATYASMLGLPGLHFGDDHGIYVRVFRFSLLSLGLALMLPAASLWKPRRETALHRAVHVVAVSSYAMYLLNWPLFQLTMREEVTRLFPSWWSQNLLFVLKQVVLIAISYAVYRYFENPLTKLRERFGSQRQPKSDNSPAPT